jgi:ABC-2 type transport system ATP-binding protein
MITAVGLRKAFGRTQALAGVDLTVAEGTVLALLGPNGAGKTTAVRVLTTLLPPDAGTATVAGYDVARQPRAVRRHIGLAGQHAAVDDLLTGRENLRMAGALYHLPRAQTRQRTGELLATFALTDAADRQTRTYSGGMRRRLDLAVALIGRPPVLFLDEPSSGLDPRTRTDLWQTIAALADQGTTVLLTTQYLEEADHLADRIAVIDAGRVIADGTADELKARFGSARLRLRLLHPADTPRAAAQLDAQGSGPAHIDADTGEISLPVDDGVGIVPEVVRRLDAAAIPLLDLAVQRPTLDEVFLALTGHNTIQGG